MKLIIITEKSKKIEIEIIKNGDSIIKSCNSYSLESNDYLYLFDENERILNRFYIPNYNITYKYLN